MNFGCKNFPGVGKKIDMETTALTLLIISSSSFLVASLALYPAAMPSTTSLENTTFAFPVFDSNDRRLYLRGNATVLNPVVQLTTALQGDNITYVVGRAMYYQPVRLRDAATGTTADFTTRFTFSIDSQKKTWHGDGLVFFLVPQGSEEIPRNSEGGLLGLVSNGTQRDNSSTFIAVEIDTFYDVSTNYWDPQCVHLGIDLNSLNSTKTACADWMDDEIRNGGRVNASISYDSSTRSLVATLQSADHTSSQGYYARVQHEVNLAEFLPENVSIGFSATTGMLFEFHTLYSWEWISSLPVLDTSSPVSMAPTPSVDDLPNGPSTAGADAGERGKKGEDRKDTKVENTDNWLLGVSRT
ncbi:hypothetical protein MLD38_032397 [Melastoma candidum]|uniref:Uncharacterized protein n=1 Tax=Melastoma candidum TaxID=119954 RepID=A0ACB9M433_9MYRT|nr:hypothetical protein MLD38_032397 [Melastoma candidum]